MLFVVCYDIAEDSARQKMARALLDFGTRVQESVYECLLDEELYQRMVTSIEKQKLAASDRLRIYRLCARCVELTMVWGPGERAEEQPFFVI